METIACPRCGCPAGANHSCDNYPDEGPTCPRCDAALDRLGRCTGGVGSERCTYRREPDFQKIADTGRVVRGWTVAR